MSTFTDDELLNKSTRLMSTKVRFFFSFERRRRSRTKNVPQNRSDTAVILRDLRNKN